MSSDPTRAGGDADGGDDSEEETPSPLAALLASTQTVLVAERLREPLDANNLTVAGKSLASELTGRRRRLTQVSWAIRTKPRRTLFGAFCVALAVAVLTDAAPWLPALESVPGGTVIRTVPIVQWTYQLPTTIDYVDPGLVLVVGFGLFVLAWVTSRAVPRRPTSTDHAGLLLATSGDGSVTACYDPGSLSADRLKPHLTTAHSDQIRLAETRVSIGEVVAPPNWSVGELIETSESQSVYVAEYGIREGRPRDGLCQGVPVSDVLETDDRGLVIDQLLTALEAAEMPVLLQVCVAARHESDQYIDAQNDAIKEHRYMTWLWRDLQSLRATPPLDLDTAAKERTDALDGATAPVFDVSVRALAITNDETSTSARHLLADRVPAELEACMPSQVSVTARTATRSRWRPLARWRTRRILAGLQQGTVTYDRPWYLGGLVARRARRMLVMDAEEVWQLLALPGRGSDRTHAALDTTATPYDADGPGGHGRRPPGAEAIGRPDQGAFDDPPGEGASTVDGTDSETETAPDAGADGDPDADTDAAPDADTDDPIIDTDPDDFWEVDDP